MIEEVITGRRIASRVLSVGSLDLRQLRGWFHDWAEEAGKSEV
jgi:hypothetical protein